MVVAAIAQLDFSSSYGNKRLSDVTLVIYEEPGHEEVGNKRAAPAVSEELPGHGVVLISASGYCRAALENWASNSNEGKHRVELPVPAGQLELGKLLVKGIYHSKLDLAGYTQQQLLHVLLLADRYEVPVVLAAICSALESIPPAELQWDTAMAIYNLPPGCAEGDACSGLCKAAAAKVQQELGDLELVWDDQKSKLKKQWLLNLPHKALKQLLEWPLTAVNSENTVCYTIQAWHEHQLQSKQQSSNQEMKQLLALIRMKHCSQLYVQTVLTGITFVRECFSPKELNLAALVASGYGAALQEAALPVFKKYPAWTADRRPTSSCEQKVIDWQVPLSQVQAVVQKSLDTAIAAADGDGVSAEDLGQGAVLVWHGRQLQPTLSCEKNNTTTGAAADAWQLSSWLRMPGLPVGAVCLLQAQLTALAFRDPGRLVSCAKGGPALFPYASPTRSMGWDLVNLGSIDNWAAALQVLRDKRLVHPAAGAAGSSGGEEFIHIRWQITDLK